MDMANAFQATPPASSAGGKLKHACEFAEKLMSALEAGEGGDPPTQGDTDCFPPQSADTAFIIIENPKNDEYKYFLYLEAVKNEFGLVSPIQALRTKFDVEMANIGCV